MFFESETKRHNLSGFKHLAVISIKVHNSCHLWTGYEPTLSKNQRCQNSKLILITKLKGHLIIFRRLILHANKYQFYIHSENCSDHQCRFCAFNVVCKYRGLYSIEPDDIEDKWQLNWNLESLKRQSYNPTSDQSNRRSSPMEVAIALVCLLYLLLAIDLIYGFKKWRESTAPKEEKKVSAFRRDDKGELRRTRSMSRTMMLINRSLKGWRNWQYVDLRGNSQQCPTKLRHGPLLQGVILKSSIVTSTKQRRN